MSIITLRIIANSIYMRMKVKLFLISLFFIIGFMDCFSQTKGVVCVYKATPPVRPPKSQKSQVPDEDIWKLYEVRL